MTLSIADEFEQRVAGPAEDIPLAGAALTFARHRYPDIDVDAFTRKLDDWAARAKSWDAVTGFEVAHALRETLATEAGFRGNDADYYNAENSYLNRVIERRVGIPISLSVIYLETAWRAGLEAAPISFPTHFVIRVGPNADPVADAAADAVFIDPFNDGRIVDTQDLREQLRRAMGDEAALNLPMQAAVKPTHKREVLARMFRNLVAIYSNADDMGNALEIADMAVRLAPEGPLERRTRGLLYWHVGHASAAIEDLSLYRTLAPNTSDAKQVDELIARAMSMKPN